ncbi:penicillin-binding protein [Virgibacillus sp. 179-BFC.A HS]|uniref:Penicillin-binding protein n=1 Tax=Tigheibacillus jepli TaxID=3035914 RepID=A0ABU5CHZ1_9BACI|nr:penicillin-binding protein [Virgibacillus sp. 179-BFC.A HS]MDY0405966.1 penicillin-binding protein [Virgibacillus sp. 179-BFC.A HS]
MTAIVMNPKTGEVLAMSNRPSYDPNNPRNVKNWYNDAVSTPFEPGSTMKIFTWAAAIDTDVYNGSDSYKSGSYRINERIQRIPDHNGGEGWGTISYDEGFRRSSNVAAAKIAWEKLGPEKFLDYLNAFDFDKKTGIDLPGEVPGKILYNWPLEKVTTAFGQGSTATPIQQMKAATAIANNGKMLQPYVIKKIVDPSTKEVVKEKKPTVVGEPISAATAKHMRDLMETVVTGKHGTGQSFRLDDYSVAGKTGTAQIPNPNGSGYMMGYDNYIFSFLGMAPKDDPQLMMYVSVKQPKLEKADGSYELGSTPVSFIFKNVMENGLHYLNIDPDETMEKHTVKVAFPDVIEKSVPEAEKLLKDKGLRPIVLGKTGKITKTSVEKGAEVLQNEQILLATDKPVMPDISGWSLREVMQLSNLLDLQVSTSGNGYVSTQSIKAGKEIKKGNTLTVKLKEPKAATN